MAVRDDARTARELLEQALAELAISDIMGFVDQQLRDARVAPQRRQNYIANLAVSYDVATHRFIVNLASSEAEDVENGLPSIDLKQAFSRSPKRKKTNSAALGVNDWYMDVPFHFASSKEADAYRTGTLQLGKAAEAATQHKSGVLDPRSSISVINPSTEAALLGMPEALKLGARAKTATKSRPATPGTEARKLPRHVAGLLSGVQLAPKSSTMLQGASGPASHALSFTTFRRVSAASDPVAWWLPAQPGVQLLPKVESQLQSEMSALVDKVVR